MKLIERVRDIVASTLSFDFDNVEENSDFMTDLFADDLDKVEIDMAIEDAFGVEIDDDVSQRLRTPASVTTWLKSQGVKD